MLPNIENAMKMSSSLHQTPVAGQQQRLLVAYDNKPLFSWTPVWAGSLRSFSLGLLCAYGMAHYS